MLVCQGITTTQSVSVISLPTISCMYTFQILETKAHVLENVAHKWNVLLSLTHLHFINTFQYKFLFYYIHLYVIHQNFQLYTHSFICFISIMFLLSFTLFMCVWKRRLCWSDQNLSIKWLQHKLKNLIEARCASLNATYTHKADKTLVTSQQLLLLLQTLTL